MGVDDHITGEDFSMYLLPFASTKSFCKQPACLAAACSGEWAARRLGSNSRRSRAADSAEGYRADRFPGMHAATSGTFLRIA